MPLMTQAEYARHRGCSQPTVADARKIRIKAAVVERDGAALIDSDLADQLWDANRVRKRLKAHAKQSPPQQQPIPAATLLEAEDRFPTDQELQAFIAGLPEDAIPELMDSIKRKEHYMAERAKVQALRDREAVGSIAEMKREAFALAKQIREGVLGIIPRVSADLAAISDQFEVERRLEGELLVALRSLADG
jgi:hypothetical protein